jgi:DNA-binding YbaB/EbfC family protein
MFGQLGDLMGMMKKAKQMKEQMDQLKAELAARVHEADAGGGAVVARVSGQGELLAVKINPDLIKSGDVEMLEDLIRAAVNAALRKNQEAMQQEMQRLTAGLGLPGMDALVKPT